MKSSHSLDCILEETSPPISEHEGQKILNSLHSLDCIIEGKSPPSGQSGGQKILKSSHCLDCITEEQSLPSCQPEEQKISESSHSLDCVSEEESLQICQLEGQKIFTAPHWLDCVIEEKSLTNGHPEGQKILKSSHSLDCIIEEKSLMSGHPEGQKILKSSHSLDCIKEEKSLLSGQPEEQKISKSSHSLDCVSEEESLQICQLEGQKIFTAPHWLDCVIEEKSLTNNHPEGQKILKSLHSLDCIIEEKSLLSGHPEGQKILKSLHSLDCIKEEKSLLSGQPERQKILKSPHSLDCVMSDKLQPNHRSLGQKILQASSLLDSDMTIKSLPDSRSRSQKILEASLKITNETRLFNEKEQVSAWLDHISPSEEEHSLVFPDISLHEMHQEQKTVFNAKKNIAFNFNFVESQANESVSSAELVKSYARQANEKRRYDKKQACFYCKVLVSKSKRHLETVHANDIDAVAMSRMSKKKQEKEFERLRILGNFNHNVTVLREKEGNLIVVRRSVGRKHNSDYLPCIYCLGFYEQEQLWRHVRSCKHRPPSIGAQDDDLPISSIKSQSLMLLQGAGLHLNCATSKDDFDDLNEYVVRRMRNDETTAVVSNDEIILSFGNGLLDKKGMEKRHEIAGRMRQLARLLITIRDVTKTKVDLFTCLSGSWFDRVVCATRQLCVVQSETTIQGVKMLQKPSLGIHLGYSLLKCCAVKRGKDLRSNSTEIHQEASTFAELMSIEWNNKVSAGAQQTLKERKYDKVELLPLTSDLLTLREFVKKELACAKENLEAECSDANWKSLAALVFVAVTCFNKRRGGEVARMTLKAFTQRPAWKDIHSKEFTQSLTILELKLLERYIILVILFDVLV